MGLMDNVLNIAKTELENQKRNFEKQLECEKDYSIPLLISFGNNELGLSSSTILRQKADGTTYFDVNDTESFRIINYSWNGPTYEVSHISNTQSDSTSTSTKKGKSGKMAAGAIIGTVLFPGVGTIVGAAIGAGGKGKTNTTSNGKSNTESITKNVEQDSIAILKLRKLNDDSVHAITIKCNSSLDAKLRCLKIDREMQVSELSKSAVDSLKGIKALKELLDIGAITQEEFDSKKKQLLN